MSWKGFKKALERMPHQLQSKIGRGAKTVDAEFDEVKERFVQMERVTKDLFQQAAQFRDGLHAMLVYQGAYLEQVLAVYRPISTDPEGVAQPVGSYTDEGASPELLRVAEDFRNRIAAIRETTDQRLGRLDTSVIAPVQDLLGMMRNIHKVIQKRDHKLLDYDRYKAAVEKAEAKEASDGQRRLPEERAYQKHGAQYQEASRQYTYYNDMLKDELRKLLALRQAFIDPVFLKFFRIQEELYTSIYRGFTDAARSCPALDLTAPVLAGWQPKWARAEEGLRAIDLWGNGQMNVAPYEFEEANRSVFDSVKGTFRKKEKTPTPASASSTFTGSPAMTGASPASSTHGSLGYSAHPAAHAATVPVDSKPPAYMSPAPQPAPPPPLPAPAAHPRPPVSYVRAIYAFSGEPTDLAFREGDKIELIQRTPDKDDWWTGRLNGRVGTFPGTYVEDI